MKRILMLLIAAIMNYGPTVLAIPNQINYQGYLTRTDGSPLDTTVTMRFGLYDMPSNGNEYWFENHTSVTVTGGLFNVRLGSITPIPDVFGSNRWLSVRVGNNSDMTPRQQMVSVAHAYRVGTVDGASGGTISGDVRINGKGNIGTSNSNAGEYAFVAGYSCAASGDKSTVGGGQGNTASGYITTVGGGQDNAVGTNWSTVGGGIGNIISSGSAATISGGSDNTATGVRATVAGGDQNHATGPWSAVSGGYANTASSFYSTAAGGALNSAAGYCSFAAGDSATVSGDHSFVMGSRIACVAENAFVWSDGSGPVLSIGSSNTFSVKATNGTRIWTNSALSSGVTIGAGGNAWVGVCDSTKKRNIRGLDTQDILNRFSSLPLKRWEYNSEDQGVEHIGPMAQDFWNAFHLGNEPLGISTIDADGVMMAAIQELAKRNATLEDQVKTLMARVQTLEADKQKTSNRGK